MSCYPIFIPCIYIHYCMIIQECVLFIGCLLLNSYQIHGMIKDLFVCFLASLIIGARLQALQVGGGLPAKSRRVPRTNMRGKDCKNKSRHTIHRALTDILLSQISPRKKPAHQSKKESSHALAICQVQGQKKVKRKCSNDLSGLRPADCGFCGSNTVPPDFTDLKLTSVWRSPK